MQGQAWKIAASQGPVQDSGSYIPHLLKDAGIRSEKISISYSRV